MSNQHLLLFSLIFTTMNDQLTGATGKLGIFGRTLSQINNDLSKGKFASLFHLVPKSEIQSLQNYGQALLNNSNKIKNWDKLLAKGKISQQTYNQTVENAVGSTKNLSTSSQLLAIKIKQLHSDYLSGKLSASEYTTQVNALTTAQNVATVSARILGTVLKTAFNIGISLAISAIISWIQDLVTENQRMAEISKQAADEIKGELDALEDYSDKIIKLRKELEDSNTTTERATNIRKELYDIQNDLIENYGVEKDDIDLVTGSLEKQIETIRNLGKAKYENQYYSKYQATKSTLNSLNNASLTLDDRAWRDERNQMWHTGNSDTAYRNDVKDYMKSVLESAGFKYKGGFYVLDGNAFDVHEALTSVEKQINDAINNLDVNDYPNPASMAQAEKNLNHILEYLSAVNNDVTSPLIAHEEELAQYIKYESKYTEQYWKLVQDRTSYEVALESGSQEEILKARQKFIEDYNNLSIADEDSATRWWFAKEFGSVANESEKAADTTVNNLNPIKEKLNELNTQLEALKETTDNAFSNQSTFQSAFDKIQEGSSLSADEVRKLVAICEKDFPEINTMFTQTADGWTISADNLIKANKALVDSTKKSVQAQIDGYQEVIDAYENRKLAMPTVDWTTGGIPSTDIGLHYEDIGITAEEYENAKNKAEEWKLVLQMLGFTLEDNTDKVDELNKKLEEYSKTSSTLESKMKSVSNAFKEQAENGSLSVDTVLSLIENGYAAALMYDSETGAIRLNKEAYLELAKAELLEQASALQASAWEQRNKQIDLNAQLAQHSAQMTLENARAMELEAIAAGNAADEMFALYQATLLAIDNLDKVGAGEYGGSGGGSSNDLIKDAFQTEQKRLKHLLEMEKITQEQYYQMLFGSDEYKALLADRTKYLDEINSLDEEYYKYQQTQSKKNVDKQIDDLEDQYKRGIITAEKYAEELTKIRDDNYGEGSTYFGTEFAKENYDSLTDKITDLTGDKYDKALDDLKKKNDGALKSEEQFIEDWIKLNDDTWKGVNPKEWQKNYNEIINYEKDFYKDLLDNGTYSAEEYRNKIKKIYFGAKGSGIDLGLDWFKSALKEADIRDYEDLKENLASDGDKTLENVRKDAEDLAKKNYTLFHDNPDTLKKNGEEIFNNLTKSAQDALSKGLISPEYYLNVIDTFANTWQEKLGLTQGIIDEAKEALEVDDWMKDWDKKHGYDEDEDKNDFELRQDRIDEYRNKIIETYGVDGVNNLKAYTEAMKEADEQQKQLNEDTYAKTKEDLSADGDKTLDNVLSDAETLWNDTLSLFAGDEDIIKENAKDIFGSVSEALKDALEKGIISADEYEIQLRSWGDKLQLTEADITDALVDTYEYRADALQKANDGSLASERKYIADMKALNFSTYGDENSDYYDPNTYASNLRDITDHELDVLEEALKKGEISTREYAEEVAKILGDADVLGADYIAEKQEEIDKVRAEREKQYWEQQKELVEDYYDKQIEELEKIQDEQEKITKAEELRLNLIKARKTLEEAKNNRNQLVFHDGTFEYMADQDAVMSAEEEVAEAVKAIKENELQEQIDLLKSQKDEALSFYDDMISMIEAYINETVNIDKSDSETLKKIADSRYSKEWKDVRYGDKTANEVTEEQKKAVEKSEDKSDTKADNNDKVTVKADNVEVKTDTNNSTDIQSNDVPEPDNTVPADTVSSIATTIKEVGDPLLAFINSFGNGSAFENLVRALGGNPTAEGVQNFKDSYNATLVGKQITPSTVVGAVTNNNSTTNNSAKTIINIEKIFENLYMPEGTTKEQVEFMFKHLNNAILQRIPQVIIDVRK